MKKFIPSTALLVIFVALGYFLYMTVTEHQKDAKISAAFNAAERCDIEQIRKDLSMDYKIEKIYGWRSVNESILAITIDNNCTEGSLAAIEALNDVYSKYTENLETAAKNGMLDTVLAMMSKNPSRGLYTHNGYGKEDGIIPLPVDIFLPLVQRDLVSDGYKSEYIALHYSAEELATLVEAGISLDVTDTEGKTALIHAIENGNYDAFYALIEAGANPWVADKKGNTPLMYAAMNERAKMVQHLMNHPRVGYRHIYERFNNRGYTALDLAKMKEYYGIVRLLGGNTAPVQCCTCCSTKENDC
jgi:hypothetical protein